MCETCYIGNTFAKYAAKETTTTVGSHAAVEASFSAVEMALGRELR